MAEMSTTYGGGGVTTRTSAPQAGAGALYDGNLLATMLMQRLQAKGRPASQGGPPIVSRAEGSGYQPLASGGGGGNQNVYVKMMGNGPNQVPGLVEVPEGTPGAVFSGTRAGGGQSGGAGRGGGGGADSGGFNRASLDADNWVEKKKASLEQHDDGTNQHGQYF